MHLPSLRLTSRPLNIAQPFQRLWANESFKLMTLAVALGLFGGYLALGFRQAAALIQFFFFGEGGEQLIAKARSLPWLHIVAATTLGGLAVGLINHFLLGGRRPQGVAGIIERAALHNGEMDLKTGLASALSSAASVGVGASVGREGAILHLTTTLASNLRRLLGVSEEHTLTLLGCGVAAAVAASFNAPIAGVFFALEVVIGHYGLRAFSPIVISSVVGTAITRTHYGDFPAYVLPTYQIATFWEFPALLLLGLVVGGAAILFMAGIFFAEDMFERSRIPVILRPAVGGLAIGAVAAMGAPEILSVGYEATDAALNQELPLHMLLLLPLLKAAATAICVGARFGGGVFAPALFIGAMIGGAFGVIASAAAPAVGAQPGLYAIVGMAAMSAAVAGAPIAAILMVFELLGDFKVTIAVMSGAAVSFVFVQGALGLNYYSWQHKRRGVRIEGARARRMLKTQRVSEVMAVHFQIVPEDMNLADLKQILHLLPAGSRMFVVAPGDRFIGTVSMDDIKDVAFDPLVYEQGIEAGHVARDYPEFLPEDATLEDALAAMERWNADSLPVVSDLITCQVAGMLDRNIVLAAYNKALLQAEAENRGR
jgi:chloride channel protein, CIC family